MAFPKVFKTILIYKTATRKSCWLFVLKLYLRFNSRPENPLLMNLFCSEASLAELFNSRKMKLPSPFDE
jgi:hypothetical protein